MGILRKIGIIFLILIGIFFAGFFIPEIFHFLSPIFYSIFNNWIGWIYLGFVIYFLAAGNIYGLGYSFTKRHRLKGTLTALFGAMMILSSVFFIILYTFTVIIFTSLPFFIVEIKLILLVVLLFGSLPIVLLVLEKWFDLSTFYKDIWKQRKDYRKLTYSVEEKGKLTYIHIHKNNTSISHIHDAAAILKIQEAFHKIKKNPNVSIALFIKSGLLYFVTIIVRNFTSWPRAKNRIYRKLNIGKKSYSGYSNKVISY